MSSVLDRKASTSTDSPREFMVSVEVYIPTTAGLGLRKPTVSHRKADRKEYRKSGEDVPKRIREKSSWISLTRSAAGTVHWRPATCKVSDEDDTCLLNIYLDETILYQTIYLHMLNHTDIRHADSSLFFHKNCIGIFSAGGQRWKSGTGSEPIYLHFDDADACNTWLILLRSYARPEIYGQTFIPSDGGLYRMWRQAELTVMQGRNLGNQKSILDVGASTVTLAEESRSEADPVDLDVFCEIILNDNVCGRTTVKKGIGSPDWHEHFLFTDLPPFEALEVLVWKEKRVMKPTLLGSVRIALTNFRRSEEVEGWFPVTHSSGVLTGVQVGEIRMKLRVSEEIILPHSSYSAVLTVRPPALVISYVDPTHRSARYFIHANVLEWMSDFERKLQLHTLSEQLMCFAIAKNVLVEHITEYADREVDGTPSSHNTLFRGNTTLTKTMELAMAFYGKEFLEASIGKILRQLCFEKIAIEVDPNRGKSAKDVERGVELLVEWCQAIWDSIYANRGNCPHEMRRLFEHVRKLVENRYKKKDGQDTQNRELPWQSVSAFCFLRFIVPAILHPHLFGLTPGLPSATVQRSLTLIAKVVQSLANLNATVQKEEYMRGIKDFLQQNIPAMVDYILVVSTPIPDTYSPHSGHPTFSHQRLKVVNSLHQRGSVMPTLEREAIPLLPHALDIPRHLAYICSSLIRSARAAGSKAKSVEKGDHLSDLCARCFEVEEIGLQRVSQLATTSSHPVVLKWDVPRPPVIHEASQSPPSPTSPVSRERRRSPRPATAPTPSDQAVLSGRKNSLPESVVPPVPSPRRLSTLRRGSVPELYSQKLPPYPEEREPRTISTPRFLRPKSISADPISTTFPARAAEAHTPSPSTHSLGSQETTSVGTSDESGRRVKNIFNGFLTRR
ncbi:GTPase activating protein [Melanogaster broomeanus]|nr:GTPase activating protein [Melanogaster broomeanus]